MGEDGPGSACFQASTCQRLSSTNSVAFAEEGKNVDFPTNHCAQRYNDYEKRELQLTMIYPVNTYKLTVNYSYVGETKSKEKTISSYFLQKVFAGTACEKCAKDNVFGPNCTSGILKWHNCFHTKDCTMFCMAV